MRLPHVAVERATGKQRFLAAFGFDPAALQHDNVVGMLNGGQPVRDDKQRFASGQLRKAPLNLVLVFGVRKGGGFVENDDRRILQNHAGNGDALLFTAREAFARLACGRVVALRQLFDERLALRGTRCRAHLFIGGIRFAEADVFKQGAAEQEVVLRDKADRLGQLRERYILDVYAADGDFACRHVPEPCDQLGNR